MNVCSSVRIGFRRRRRDHGFEQTELAQRRSVDRGFSQFLGQQFGPLYCFLLDVRVEPSKEITRWSSKDDLVGDQGFGSHLPPFHLVPANLGTAAAPEEKSHLLLREAGALAVSTQVVFLFAGHQ